MSANAGQPVDVGVPAALAKPAAYPHDPGAAQGVTEIQTHLSWVFLTRERVYKVRKSVDLGFVSFLSREERNADCVREVHLNRRLAPDVYLGVAPIERRGDGFAVGEIDPEPGTLPPLEHCVVMRRLPDGRDASTLVDAGALQPAWLDRVAVKLGEFHATHGLGRPSPFSPEQWRAAIWGPVEANCDSLVESGCPTVSTRDVEALRARSRAVFDRLAPRFEARRADGRAVDAHGDLHLEHVWFETDDAEPVVIDCLEFSSALRHIDAASELAFLAMDLGFRGHTDLGDRFLARYAAASDDYDLYSVVDFFISYRSGVRGKVEAIASQDARIHVEQRERSARLAAERVAFAMRVLEGRSPGCVFLVGGIIGSGKSTVARALADLNSAAIVASDRVRLSIDDGTASAAGADWQQGRYAPEATGRVYEEMLVRAVAVVQSGRPVILDASWADAARRARARAWAAEQGAETVFVEVRCGRDETLVRLARRQREGTDPSEAGPELYDAFVASFEPVEEGEWAGDRHWQLETDRASWGEELLFFFGPGD